jgi:hypothetical protein
MTWWRLCEGEMVKRGGLERHIYREKERLMKITQTLDSHLRKDDRVIEDLRTLDVVELSERR